MKAWRPPTQGVARLGELRLLVVDSPRGRVLWRGGKVYKLSEGVKDAESLEEFEADHTLPDIDERFHLGVDGSGKQLYIIPNRVTSSHGPGLGYARNPASSDVHELLRSFLGRRSENSYGVQIDRPKNVQSLGQVRLVVYAADKTGSVGQRGEFVHKFTHPLPALYGGPDGWFICGGRYHVEWRGIVG